MYAACTYEIQYVLVKGIGKAKCVCGTKKSGKLSFLQVVGLSNMDITGVVAFRGFLKRSRN